MNKPLRIFVSILALSMLPATTTRAYAQEEKQAQLERLERQRIAAEERRLENRRKEASTVINTNPSTSAAQRMKTAASNVVGVPALLPNTIFVTSTSVWFMYMEPGATVELPKSQRHGHYVWRWNMTEGTRPFSLVFAADTAMRTDKLGDIVKASRVRRCRNIFETVTAACDEPVQASVVRFSNGFRIEVTDSALVNAFKLGRPSSAKGVFLSPLGRANSTSVSVRYHDSRVPWWQSRQ